MAKTPLKSKINRFFYRNRSKGLPRLMLYIAIGNLVVYLLYLLKRSDPLFYRMLLFDRSLILKGQVWRLFTYPFVFLTESGFIIGAIGLLFFYWCGSILEQYWGVLRFNVYYLSGVLLTDIAALLLRENAGIGYVNTSLFLAVATVLPEQTVRIWFILPVKMKWLAWVDIGFTLAAVIIGLIQMFTGLSAGGFPYLGWLLPIVALLNYVLFFGKDIANVLPDFMRRRPAARHRTRPVQRVQTVRIVQPVRPVNHSSASARPSAARFRCTVCGRTELTNPELEFRYCSKCAGYRCYCMDHIHNHVHITETKQDQE